MYWSLQPKVMEWMTTFVKYHISECCLVFGTETLTRAFIQTTLPPFLPDTHVHSNLDHLAQTGGGWPHLYLLNLDERESHQELRRWFHFLALNSSHPCLSFKNTHTLYLSIYPDSLSHSAQPSKEEPKQIWVPALPYICHNTPVFTSLKSSRLYFPSAETRPGECALVYAQDVWNISIWCNTAAIKCKYLLTVCIIHSSAVTSTYIIYEASFYTVNISVLLSISKYKTAWWQPSGESAVV